MLLQLSLGLGGVGQGGQVVLDCLVRSELVVLQNTQQVEGLRLLVQVCGLPEVEVGSCVGIARLIRCQFWVL